LRSKPLRKEKQRCGISQGHEGQMSVIVISALVSTVKKRKTASQRDFSRDLSASPCLIRLGPRSSILRSTVRPGSLLQKFWMMADMARRTVCRRLCHLSIHLAISASYMPIESSTNNTSREAQKCPENATIKPYAIRQIKIIVHFIAWFIFYPPFLVLFLCI